MPRWLKRRRAIVLGVLLACYTVFVMLGGFADKFVLYPSTDPIDAEGAVRRAVPFQSGELEIWVAGSRAAIGRQPVAHVLRFIGNASRAELEAGDTADWDNEPVEVWTVNYPGYGRSTPPARLERLPPAALAAYDAIAQQGNGRPIFVAGTSLGTALALHVAANRPVAGIVLRSPPPLRQLILGRFGWWNLWLAAWPVARAIPPEMDSLSNARKLSVPAVFLLTNPDEVVPMKYQRMVMDAYAGPKQVVALDGFTHNMPLDDAAQRRLEEKLNWLWQTAGL